MRHLDLFSGIGGFALAASWVWPDHEVVAFCEMDKYCQQVLGKHWPGVPIIEDVKEVTVEAITNAAIQRLHHEKDEQILEGTGGREFLPLEPGTYGSTENHGIIIDLLTGGFPCQPFSVAGKQRGDKDDRFLWPQMLRVIADTRPRWIIGENVAGIINMALDGVLSDLEAEGYTCWPVVIPACAKNAKHRRDRVWIIAHDDRLRLFGTADSGQGGNAKKQTRPQAEQRGGVTTDTAIDLRGTSGDEGSCASYRGRETMAVSHRTRSQGRDSDLLRQRPEQFPSWAGGTWQMPNPLTEYVADTERSRACRQQKDRALSQDGGIENQPHGIQAPSEAGDDRNGAGKLPQKQREIERDFRYLSDGLPAGMDYSLTDKHGIMGFIYSLRRVHYAKTQEAGTREALSLLREFNGEETIREPFGRFNGLFKKEILRCPLHGEGNGKREGGYFDVTQAGSAASKEEMRILWEEVESPHTPQGREYREQCTCQLDNALRLLSSEMALATREVDTEKAEAALLSMWGTSKSQRLLPKPLQAFSEVWQSAFNEEIRTVKRDSEGRLKAELFLPVSGRVHRLRALGNAIAPEAVVPIMQAIKEIDQEGD